MNDEGERMNKRLFSLHPSALILLLGDGLLWFAMALLTVFICWPAMWVAPIETIQTAILLGLKYSTGPHAKGVFFLGESLSDPGPLFYPVTWLYHTSPLVMLGLVGVLIVWLHKDKGRGAEEQKSGGDPAFIRQPSTLTRYLPPILLFILGYYLLMTIGEKKQERYFLPVYPWLDLLAGVGLVAIVNFLSFRFNAHVDSPDPPRSTLHVSRTSLVTVFLILLILVLQKYIFR